MANECTLWTKDGKLIKNSEGKLILSRSCPCTPQMCQAYYLVTDVPDSTVEKTCSGVAKSFIKRTHGLYIINAAAEIPLGGTPVGDVFVCGKETRSYIVEHKVGDIDPGDCCECVKDKIKITKTSTKEYICPDKKNSGVYVEDYKIIITPEPSTKEDGGYPATTKRTYTFSYTQATGCDYESPTETEVPATFYVRDPADSDEESPKDVYTIESDCGEAYSGGRDIAIHAKEDITLYMLYDDIWLDYFSIHAGGHYTFNSCFESGGYSTIRFTATKIETTYDVVPTESATIITLNSAEEKSDTLRDLLSKPTHTPNIDNHAPCCSWDIKDGTTTLLIENAMVGAKHEEDCLHEISIT